MPEKEKKSISGRVFEIVTNLYAETGEEYINAEAVRQICETHKIIKRYAYIIHDKDVYNANDEAQNPNHKKGTPKSKHIHLVLDFGKSPYELELVAKWFNIKSNFIALPKGQNAFLDKVRYLTHESEKEQLAGKYLYPDSEVVANFDFRTAINEMMETIKNYGANVSKMKRFRHDVMYSGKTLKQCRTEDPLNYLDDCDRLAKLRIHYINNLEPPKLRQNIYVCGQGGTGKSITCRAIARSLFPELKNDSDIFFVVGAENALFEGYDGQPVIIWEECRALTLFKRLNGREGVYQIFDTHPTSGRQNIKYGSVNLCNVVNIINSVQDFNDFLDGLAGEYIDRNGETHLAEDKNQSYRRFPYIINLKQNSYDLFINKGFADSTDEYQTYFTYKDIPGNMQKIVSKCEGNKSLSLQLQAKCVSPIIDKYNEITKKLNNKSINEKEIIKEFENIGKITEQVIHSSEECKSVIFRSDYESITDRLEFILRTFPKFSVQDVINEYKGDTEISPEDYEILKKYILTLKPDIKHKEIASIKCKIDSDKIEGQMSILDFPECLPDDYLPFY